MELSKNPKDRILSLVAEFSSLRDTLATGLLDIAAIPEVKLWVIDTLTKERLLPFGSSVSDCPQSMSSWLTNSPEFLERYRTVTFREMLDWMTDEEVLDYPELINEFFDYIKEHRVIGTVIDW